MCDSFVLKQILQVDVFSIVIYCFFPAGGAEEAGAGAEEARGGAGAAGAGAEEAGGAGAAEEAGGAGGAGGEEGMSSLQ